MAEPVRKCSRCRLRVQGVRPHEDGHSYCVRCLAQVELEEQERAAEPLAASSDVRGPEPPEEQPVTRDPASETPTSATAASEQPPAAPAPAPAMPEPAAQPSAMPEPAATAAPAPSAPAPLRERTITGRERGAITGSEGGSALAQALHRERASLLQHRSELIDELHHLERDIEAINLRVDHVDALLDPNHEQNGQPSAA